MTPISSQQTRHSGVRCAVCETHARPMYVPWEQHALGCAVRAAVLGRRRPTVPTALRIAGPVTTL
jgi:hypothetical protein